MENIFENQTTDIAVPRHGQKITFTDPAKFAFHNNVINDQKLLEVGKEYTVRKTQLNSSSSYVWLEELEAYDVGRDMPYFNLWSFVWEGRPQR